jgi:hypothetical protein
MSLYAEPSIGSDHMPLIFSSGEDSNPRSSSFLFEKGWLALPGFSDLLLHKCFEFGRVRGHCFDLIDVWQWHSRKLRGFLRGWGANLRKDSMAEKNEILQQISVLDSMADGVGLNDDRWGLCYHLEESLMLIYQREEDYWRQRSRVQWTLQGDANTAYFHAIANGRRQKCVISALASPSGPITDKFAIQEHVYSF